MPAAQRDVSAEASAAVRAVRSMAQSATLSQVVDVLRGALTRTVKDRGHDSLPEHGACKALRCTFPAKFHPEYMRDHGRYEQETASSASRVAVLGGLCADLLHLRAHFSILFFLFWHAHTCTAVISEA